jgi:hypothetical protein
MGSSGKFKRSSVDSQTGQPGMGGGLGGPVYRERVVKKLNDRVWNQLAIIHLISCMMTEFGKLAR